MKTIFIECRWKGKINFKSADKLPKRTGLITTVQFAGQIEIIKKEIEKTGRKCFLSKGIQCHEGQVLGCESSAAESIKDKVDAFLYIGTGEFHPINVFLKTGKPVMIFNPISGKIEDIKRDEIEKIEKRKNAAYAKFLNAERIGILVTTKPGQQKLKEATALKKKIEKQGKKAYIFVDNTFNVDSLENFPFIQAWVNTACPRIIEDFSCMNLEDIP